MITWRELEAEIEDFARRECSDYCEGCGGPRYLGSWSARLARHLADWLADKERLRSISRASKP